MRSEPVERYLASAFAKLRRDKLRGRGSASSFAPNYPPEEIFGIATKLYKNATNL
jgi:hypothetical protein